MKDSPQVSDGTADKPRGGLAAMRARMFAMLMALCLVLAPAARADEAKAGATVAVTEAGEHGKPAAQPSRTPEAGAANSNSGEINFNRTLVIEGKVEKPQVTFTLLKEPPPEREIRFEASFMDDLLKPERENTFSPGEAYGRE